MQHSHSFSGSTTYVKNHIHNYGGVTAKAASGIPHVHSMEGNTTFNVAHEHTYMTRTGPAIPVQDGLHYHYFKTRVTLVKGHSHYIYGKTSID
ncbi:MAG: hypothetical protein H7Y18_13585 [Clostridiaceae bacterium]|nr:hypothetical protein [Clostridiaceae bacterium]